MLNDNFITTMDGGGTLLKLYCMIHFIGKGQWLVRWVPDLINGLGYPLFNFYPPLFYIVGAALAKTGLTICWAMNLSCLIFVFFSGYAMYLFAKELWGAEGGFLSAVAYLFVPYHLVDLYVRGSAAELASFAFLPLILWGFLRLSKDLKARYVLITSFSIAGLCLTHNCMTLIFCPVILLYILLLHFPFHRPQQRSLVINLLTFGLGIGLAAFFVLPALIEKSFVHTERLLSGNLDFHGNFLSIQQLIYSPWGYGMPYGKGGMSFQIGPVHCLLAMIALCLMQRITKDRPFVVYQLLFFSFVFIGAIFFILPCSVFIWEHIAILKFIQFPWRLLVVVTFIVSVMTGGITLLSGPKYRIIIMSAGVLAILLVNLPYCHPHASNKIDLSKFDPATLLRSLVLQDGGEYIPIWATAETFPIFADKLDVLKGDTQIRSTRYSDSKLHYTFTVETHSPSLLSFNVFYFPGWNIKVDGHLVDISKDNPFGIMLFSLNEGLHEIKADFGPTPVRRIGVGISIISLLILLGFSFFRIFLLSRNKTI